LTSQTTRTNSTIPPNSFAGQSPDPDRLYSLKHFRHMPKNRPDSTTIRHPTRGRDGGKGERSYENPNAVLDIPGNGIRGSGGPHQWGGCPGSRPCNGTRSAGDPGPP